MKRTATFAEPSAKKQKTEFRFPIESRDIIIHIAELLSGKDLLNFSTLCKGIHKTIEPKVYQVDGPEKVIASAFDRVEVKTNNINEEIIKKRFQKIKSIKIIISIHNLTSSNKLFPIVNATKLFPSLEDVEIQTPYGLSMTNEAEQIKRLRIISTAPESMGDAVYLYQRRNLEKLSIITENRKICLVHVNTDIEEPIKIAQFQGIGTLERRYGLGGRNRKFRKDYIDLDKNEIYSF